MQKSSTKSVLACVDDCVQFWAACDLDMDLPEGLVSVVASGIYFCRFADARIKDDGEIESENSGRYSDGLWRHQGHMGGFSILALSSQQEKAY